MFLRSSFDFPSAAGGRGRGRGAWQPDLQTAAGWKRRALPLSVKMKTQNVVCLHSISENKEQELSHRKRFVAFSYKETFIAFCITPPNAFFFFTNLLFFCEPLPWLGNDVGLSPEKC
jgi:hypothetical protein